MDENSNSFGQMFRAAREAAGRQLSDVAAELHINVAHLQALEDEAFDRLPSRSFARGYIRAYCRALETDPEPLLKAYLRSAPPVDEWHASQPLDETMRPSRLPLVIGTTVVAATVVALFVAWFLGSGYLDDDATVVDQAAIENASPAVAEAIEAPARLPVAPVPSESSDAPEDGDKEENANPTPSPTPASQDDPTSEPADDAGAETGKEAAVAGDGEPSPPRRAAGDSGNPDLIRAPDGKDRVEIRLTDKSWVDIRDANGHRLLRGLYLKGAEKTLIGQAPFQVFLGNAPAVELKAGGKPFDLKPYVRDNNTARFAVLKQAGDN